MSGHDLTADEVEQVVGDAFATLCRIQQATEPSLVLRAGWLETPIGHMLAAGDDEHLHLLCYIDKSSLVRKIAVVQKSLKARLELGDSRSVARARDELREYFAGARREFTVPLDLRGSTFQVRVWNELRAIPFGGTISYAELAQSINKPAAFRAVAQANAQNPVAIIIPGHRIVNADGEAGGYNAGLDRKRWLLDFEKRILGEAVR